MLRRSHAHLEGGQRRFSVTTEAFVGQNQVVKNLRCAEVEWSEGGNGAPPQPKEKPGTEFELEADLVILAMGFWGPGNKRLVRNVGVALDEKGHVKANADQMTDAEGVFVAGDMTTGQSLVVRAIASGQRTAGHIVSYFERNRASRP